MKHEEELDVVNIEEVNISQTYFEDDIDIVVTDKRSADINAFLAQFFSTLDFSSNIRKVVNPDLNYVVKFTPELLKKMQEHDIQFN